MPLTINIKPADDMDDYTGPTMFLVEIIDCDDAGRSMYLFLEEIRELHAQLGEFLKEHPSESDENHR